MKLRAFFFFLAGLLAMVSGPALADPLTSDQQKAVETVIHDYLLAHPEIVEEALKAAGERRAAHAMNELMADKSAPGDGNPKGDVTIVEFFDYNCPYCKLVAPTLATLLKEDPKLHIVYREFPILGKSSVLAAHAALAAQEQGKYLELHNALIALKGKLDDEQVLATASKAGVDVARLAQDMTKDDIDALLQKNFDFADTLGIRATPTFIIGGKLVPSALSLESLRKLIAEARAHG